MYYQLYQWYVEKLFKNSDEVITKELKIYIEDREKLNTKNKSQLFRTMFPAKYGSLDLYDIDLKNSSLTMNNFNLEKKLAGHYLVIL